MSRTGVIFGLKSLNISDLEEIRELGNYYLLGNDGALHAFNEQIDHAVSAPGLIQVFKEEMKALETAVKDNKDVRVKGHVHAIECHCRRPQM
jgi:hypothetical protein